MMDAVVIGAGAAGLTAAIRLAQAGRSVSLLTKGIGGLQLSQGTVDVFGYDPKLVSDPFLAVAAVGSEHPYSSIGMEATRAGVEFFAKLVGPSLITGDGSRNFLLPTAVGAVRPTALAQPSMVAGEVEAGKKFVIVGLRRIKDFYPELVAANLARTRLVDGGVTARAVTVDVPARTREIDSSALVYARAMDDAGYRKRMAASIRPHLQDGETVGMPAMLGIKDHDAWADFQDKLGHPVFEIPLPPPSVPGMRLNERLTDLARDAGVRIMMGSKVVGKTDADGRVRSVSLATAGRNRDVVAENFIYAPGGFESGALAVDSHMQVSESAFGLPLRGADEPDLITEQYWDGAQPLFRVGVAVNERMQAVDPRSGSVLYPNLYCAGGVIAGAARWAEKSGEGIALGSAVRAVDSILGE